MSKQMQSINHDRYNKICDDILFLGHNTMLKLNVSLYTNTENYGKLPYHKEYEYYDKVSGSNMITIKRSYDYYISIENIKVSDDGVKEFIRIGLSEIMLMRQSLNLAIKWFTDKEFEGLYATSKGRLILAMKTKVIQINDLPMGKYLILEPIVLSYNETHTPGVRIYLSSVSNYVDLAINRFMGFTQFMNDINIFEAAQNMLNYVGRPEFGTNMYSFPNQQGNESERDTSGKIGRQIPSTNKSIFDKL